MRINRLIWEIILYRVVCRIASFIWLFLSNVTTSPHFTSVNRDNLDLKSFLLPGRTVLQSISICWIIIDTYGQILSNVKPYWKNYLTLMDTAKRAKPESCPEFDAFQCVSVYSTCIDRKWQCTTNQCDGTCSVYGAGHYITFDQKRFVFDGSCEYILTQVLMNAHRNFW